MWGCEGEDGSGREDVCVCTCVHVCEGEGKKGQVHSIHVNMSAVSVQVHT